MSEDWWDGALWVYIATITNNGANSGAHVYNMVPGAGNEVELLYGHILNGDTSARVCKVNMTDDEANALAALLDDLAGISLTGGVTNSFPMGGDVPAAAGSGAGPTRFMVAGTMALNIQAAAVGTSQDTRVAIVCRIRGGVPTVTLTSPTGATEAVVKNQVY